MRLKHSFCNSENRIESELLQVSEVSHKSWSLTIRLVIKRLLPIVTISAATKIVLTSIDSHRTAFTKLEIVTMSAFYYVSALFAADLVYDNLLHAINLQSNAPNVPHYQRAGLRR